MVDEGDETWMPQPVDQFLERSCPIAVHLREEQRTPRGARARPAASSSSSRATASTSASRTAPSSPPTTRAPVRGPRPSLRRRRREGPSGWRGVAGSRPGPDGRSPGVHRLGAAGAQALQRRTERVVQKRGGASPAPPRPPHRSPRARSVASRISSACASSPRRIGTRRQTPSGPSSEASTSSAKTASKISSSRRWQIGPLDGHHRLDAAIEVARHEVGRPDEVVAASLGACRTGRSASARGTGRRSTAPGSSPTCRARPGAGSRCPRTARSIRVPACDARVQRVDHLGVDEAVHLQHDLARRARAAPSARIISSSGAAQRERRDEQLAVGGLAAVAGQQVEQVGDVGARAPGRPSAGRGPRRATPSSSCSCRCRCARSGGSPAPRAARPGRPWRGS